jgi:hypothetical protein
MVVISVSTLAPQVCYTVGICLFASRAIFNIQQSADYIMLKVRLLYVCVVVFPIIEGVNIGKLLDVFIHCFQQYYSVNHTPQFLLPK